MFHVVSHRNIHRKRKLHESVISSLFVNNTKSHIAKKHIMSRDRINVLTKPGNYYIFSALFSINIILGVLNVRDFY